MLKEKMDAIIKRIWTGFTWIIRTAFKCLWAGFKWITHTIQTVFKCLWAGFKWVVWELFGFHFIWKKLNPKYKPDEQPVTIGIWLITFYLACYGFASTRYENRLDRAEFKYNTFITHLAAGVPFDSTELRKIGNIKLPIEPSFSCKGVPDVINSLRFPSQNQIYAKSENFESTEEFVRDLIIQWKHKLNNANLWWANLEGANLEGANLMGANLMGALLWRANLEGANLAEVNLWWANLTGANLEGTNLEGVNLWLANLKETKNLTTAQLIKAKTIYKAKLPPELEKEIRSMNYGHLLDTKPQYLEEQLAKANLFRADLQGVDLEGTNFQRSNLQGANLTRANLTRANLTRANLTRANLMGANLTEASLTRANLMGALLWRANLEGANLEEANLEEANLWEADLKRVKNLTVAQLITAESLYKTILSFELKKEVRDMGYGHLLDTKPQIPWE